MDLTYSMASTISISEEMKEKLKNLGRAGDSYEDVIRKMYEISRKQLLLDFLHNSTDTISIEEMREEINKKWPKSKSQKN